MKFMKKFFASMITLVTSCGVVPAMADPVGGRVMTDDVVLPFSVDTYTVSVVAGTVTQVLVAGSVETDIDCAVYDVWGNLIAADERASSVCNINFGSISNQLVTIAVMNRGNAANAYRLLVR